VELYVHFPTRLRGMVFKHGKNFIRKIRLENNIKEDRREAACEVMDRTEIARVGI
jgi:hypothetical protein